MIGCFSGMQATPLPCFKAERALKSKKYISKTYYEAVESERILKE